MKKIFLAGLAFVMLAAAFGGCGGTPESSAAPSVESQPSAPSEPAYTIIDDSDKYGSEIPDDYGDIDVWRVPFPLRSEQERAQSYYEFYSKERICNSGYTAGALTEDRIELATLPVQVSVKYADNKLYYYHEGSDVLIYESDGGLTPIDHSFSGYSGTGRYFYANAELVYFIEDGRMCQLHIESGIVDDCGPVSEVHPNQMTAISNYVVGRTEVLPKWRDLYAENGGFGPLKLSTWELFCRRLPDVLGEFNIDGMQSDGENGTTREYMEGYFPTLDAFIRESMGEDNISKTMTLKNFLSDYFTSSGVGVYAESEWRGIEGGIDDFFPEDGSLPGNAEVGALINQKLGAAGLPQIDG